MKNFKMTLIQLLLVIVTSCGGGAAKGLDDTGANADENLNPETYSQTDFEGIYSLRDTQCPSEVESFRLTFSDSATLVATIIDGGDTVIESGDVFVGTAYWDGDIYYADFWDSLGCYGIVITDSNDADYISSVLLLDTESGDVFVFCVDDTSADGVCGASYGRE